MNRLYDQHNFLGTKHDTVPYLERLLNTYNKYGNLCVSCKAYDAIYCQCNNCGEYAEMMTNNIKKQQTNFRYTCEHCLASGKININETKLFSLKQKLGAHIIKTIIPADTNEENDCYIIIKSTDNDGFLFMGTSKPVQITDLDLGIARRLIKDHKNLKKGE